MAISPTAVWDVRGTGNDANGGFYTSGGTDYSQQDTAQLSVTDGVTNGTTTVTSATAGFTAAMIGNGINIAGTPVEIKTFVNTNTITVDRTMTAAGGQTMKVGGRLATLAKAMANAVAGNIIYPVGSETITAQITPANSGDSTGGPIRVYGGASARNDGGRYQINTSTNSITMFGLTNKKVWEFYNLYAHNTAATPGIGFVTQNAQPYFFNCKIDGCSYAIYYLNSGALLGCELYCGAGQRCLFVQDGNPLVEGCLFKSTSTTTPVVEAYSNSANELIAIDCVFSGGQRSFHNTNTAGTSFSIRGSGNVFHNTAGDAIRSDSTTATPWVSLINSVFHTIGGYAVNFPSITSATRLRSAPAANNGYPWRNIAFYSVTSGRQSNFYDPDVYLTLASDPFTNAAAGDFSLSAYGLSNLKAAGVPGASVASYGGYRDIGIQHQDSVGTGTGGGMRIYGG